MTAAPDLSLSGPSFSPDYGDLHVRVAGAGPPLVLLHGLASSSRYWLPHLDRLGSSYRVIAPDLLGFGRSPKPEGATYTAEEHLAALLAALEPRLDGPATLVGHSMGAMLALHLATVRPDLVARLLLVALPALDSCMWGHEPDGLHRYYHRFAVHTPAGRALFSASIRAIGPVWHVVAPRVRPDLPPGAARDALVASWTGYWRSLEAVVYRSDVAGMFRGVAAPVTVLHGARDRVVPVGPVRALASSRADARYIEVGEAHHNPCYSHPTVFYDALGLLAQPAS